MGIQHVTEGFRILSRRIYLIFNKLKKYPGTKKEMLKKIVDDCYNGKFFQVSNGNFKAFYMRDFGICVKDLLVLGYKKECIKTMRFALKYYQRDQRITTTITLSGKTVNFFDESIDGFAFYCDCLKEINDKKLINDSKEFIQKKAKYIYEQHLDKKTGLIKKGKAFSSIKDQGVRNSSCYDNCMIAMASDCLDFLKFKNPFKKYDYKKVIMREFWQGDYFYEDLDKKEGIYGDSNVFPFWCNVIDDKNVFDKCFKSIKKAGLDSPFPLKYSRKKDGARLSIMNILSPNYEGNTIWAHLGLCFIDVIYEFDKKVAKRYYEQYLNLLKKHRNFLEVYNPDGKPFKTALYYSDDGLLWASKLLRRLEQKGYKLLISQKRFDC